MIETACIRNCSVIYVVVIELKQRTKVARVKDVVITAGLVLHHVGYVKYLSLEIWKVCNGLTSIVDIYRINSSIQPP